MSKSTLTRSKAGGKTELNVVAQAGERGWALLGLVLALAIMGIMLAALAPNVQFQVRRDKEAEMLYRGDQMARAIARYYNNGRLGTINVLNCPQPRGCLLELEKLKEPYMVGINEVKLVRLSATIDPMNNGEWEPVRLRDPRLQAVLQAYASETGLAIPQIYEHMAGPPAPLLRAPSVGSTTPPAGSNTQGGSAQGGTQGGDPDDDDDDDDLDNPPDPLAKFFANGDSGPGLSNIPIVGVAPKIKGPSVRTLYGLQNYEEWVFIYIPAISYATGTGSGTGTGTGTQGRPGVNSGAGSDEKR
jgi:hypothetical protein